LAAFEWDERKRLANLTKHGIDFRDAVVAVVWTDRGGAIRIISVRAARRNERQIYHARCGA
jgi:uncharacterized DUF497 family protein